MQFDSFTEFLSMGGHALYVWLAYGTTVAVFALNYILARQAMNRQVKKLAWQAMTEEQSAKKQAELDAKSQQG